MSTQIPQELYSKIHAVMPIPCVDAIIAKDDSFLLVKRTNKPAQGAWWFPGGRVHKGELLADAAKRKVNEEVGLDVHIEKVLGHKETLFPDGPFGGPTHTINTLFLCVPVDLDAQIQTDSQSETSEWFSVLDQAWDPYVLEGLRLAGFPKKYYPDNTIHA